MLLEMVDFVMRIMYCICAPRTGKNHTTIKIPHISHYNSIYTILMEPLDDVRLKLNSCIYFRDLNKNMFLLRFFNKNHELKVTKLSCDSS